jgi:phosphoglycerate dehydrogenase-like enzyme
VALKLLIAGGSLTDAHAAEVAASAAGWADCTRLPLDATRAQFQTTVAEADIVVGWPEPAWLLDGRPRLVLLPGAGYEEFLGHGLGARPGLTLCNTRGVYDVGCAEHAVALMLALTRNLGAHVREASARRWNRSRHYGEVAGTTACIVGLGDIGQALAWRCAGLGMNVIGVRRTQAALPRGVERVYPPEQLLTAVASAAHVFGTLPGGSDTCRIFGREIFAAMPAGAYFYNVGRGSSVDEGALIDALRSGHLGGAGLDVLDPEPPSPDHPLWEMENVIITPHVAGLAARHAERLCQLVIENLMRWHAGQPLLNPLDLD